MNKEKNIHFFIKFFILIVKNIIFNNNKTKKNIY